MNIITVGFINQWIISLDSSLEATKRCPIIPRFKLSFIQHIEQLKGNDCSAVTSCQVSRSEVKALWLSRKQLKHSCFQVQRQSLDHNFD